MDLDYSRRDFVCNGVALASIENRFLKATYVLPISVYAERMAKECWIFEKSTSRDVNAVLLVLESCMEPTCVSVR